MLWGYYVYSYLFLWTYLLRLKHQHVLTITFGACFHFLFFMTFLSYTRAVSLYAINFSYDLFVGHLSLTQHKIFTNPGEAPVMFDSVKFRTNEFKANGSTDRYCQKCQRKKPDRAHHCKFFRSCRLLNCLSWESIPTWFVLLLGRICRRCVLKMDHHCKRQINGISEKAKNSIFSFFSFLLSLF